VNLALDPSLSYVTVTFVANNTDYKGLMPALPATLPQVKLFGRHVPASGKKDVQDKRRLRKWNLDPVVWGTTTISDRWVREFPFFARESHSESVLLWISGTGQTGQPKTSRSRQLYIQPVLTVIMFSLPARRGQALTGVELGRNVDNSITSIRLRFPRNLWNPVSRSAGAEFVKQFEKPIRRNQYLPEPDHP
jgi:hypothetical protein